MVTKQQQLEYAAKHIEKWKSGYDYAVIEEDTDGHLYIRWPSVCASGVTKKEWQQERDKMKNKPSWSAAPGWAEFLAQSPTGSWEWYSGKPIAGAEFWMHVDAGIHGETENHGGKVLGDWLCTLEARPEVIIKNNTAATITATQAGENEMTITAQDNSWHERGEFPPAGCECEMLCDMRWGEVFIVGVSRGGNIVIEDEIGAIMEAINCQFRPIRTEREKAIEDMSRLMHEHDSVINDITLGALYDAGYRMEQSK